MIDHTATRPRIRVMHSVAAPDGTTKFVDQMVDGAASEVSISFFSWKSAFLGRFDIFHIHWPERLVRKGAVRTLLLIASLKARRIRVVRTLHNLAPHEAGSGREVKVLNYIDKRTDLFVLLNRSTPRPQRGRSVVILHGHYKDRFDSHAPEPSVDGRILFFGIIRPYKNVESLVSAFHKVRETSDLRIVGSPSPQQRTFLETVSERDPRVTTLLDFVPDAMLVTEVTSAQLVVLPYSEMHNSGALLVALSLGRPVLVPATPSNISISEEVGPGWVTTYEGELTTDILESALVASGTIMTGSAPQLSERDWPVLGEHLYQAYISLYPNKN